MVLAALLALLAQDGREGRSVLAEFTRLEGRSIVVSVGRDPAAAASKVTLPLADDAQILLDGAKAKPADLKPGASVRVWVQGGMARRIESPASPAEGGDREGSGVSGQVVRTADGTLVLGVKPDGQKPSELTLKTDRETVVLVDGEKAKLEDLKPGTPVRAWVRRELAVRIEGSRKADPGKPAAPAPEPARPKPPEAPAAKAPEKPKPPEPPPEPPKPFPVDESIVPKGEKYPDLGGRVLSVFADGPMLLVTIRQNQEELPFYIPKDAGVSYVGLEKPDQKPRVGYLAYVWLRPGSKDTASSVRFGRGK